MSRYNAFHALQVHPMIGRIFKKLSVKDLLFCRDFILETDQLSDDEFALRVNRLWTAGEVRPKNHIEMYALLSQSIKPKIRRRSHANAT